MVLRYGGGRGMEKINGLPLITQYYAYQNAACNYDDRFENESRPDFGGEKRFVLELCRYGEGTL